MKYPGFILVAISITLHSCYTKSGHRSLESDITSEKEIVDYTKQSLNVTDFIKWCTDTKNGLSKEEEISDISYKLFYMPAESMAFLELRTENYNEIKFKKTLGNYTDMTYFNLKIALINGSGELLKHNLNSPAQYEQRVKYISFEIQNDIYLVQEHDTIYSGLYQSERIFEVAPYSVLMLGFDNKKFDKTKEFTLVFNDKLFEKGNIKFNYSARRLANVPNIIGL